MEKEAETIAKAAPKDVAASKHATRYLIVGTTLALFNYGFYAILANLIIKNNDLIWLSTFIATAATTILAYILHSRIISHSFE